ncbi:MAG: hypothetical protein HZB81_00190 [Deltaproteobacteria bacterium]|nr:hypothetical protein [Deltaproteobacteria bacterium]
MLKKMISFLVFILISVTCNYSFGKVRNLSSMEISTHSGDSLQVELLIIDPQGNKTGFDPSVNAIVEQIPNSGWGVDDFPGIPPTRFVGIGEPKGGIYKVEIIGINRTTTYTFGIRMADSTGNFHQPVFNGITSLGIISIYTITYDPTPGITPKVERVVTTEDLKNDINIAFDLGLIDNAGIKQSLLAKLDVAENSIKRGQKQAAINQLNAFINEVNAQKGKHIKDEAFKIFLEDAQYIMEHL